MFGSHLSIAGGLHLALHSAAALALDCVQIFTKNQRQWSVPPLSPAQIKEWEHHRKSSPLATVVSHDSYLINLASPPGPNRNKSIALFRDELERCELLGIPWLVTHPGSHLGQGEEEGLRQIVAALDQIHADLPGYKTTTCLEITAGQGTNLGCRLEHLRFLRDHARHPDRLAVCLDTAHLLAAGYDLTSADGMKQLMAEIDRVVGLGSVKVWHLNDSKTPRGSRVDRHAHWGQGHISPQAMQWLLRHPGVKKTPKILETPKEDAPDGQPWDVHNLRWLKELSKPAPRRGKMSEFQQ